MTREEHLKWAKERALEYVEVGDFQEAFASMASDLTKHPELADHPGIKLGMIELLMGNLKTREEITRWITGFN